MREGVPNKQTATAEGDSFTFTPGNLPSDTYNFKIKNNEDGTINYSGQFPYQGTGTLPSKTEAETSAAETSAEETTSAPATTSATTLTTVSKSISTKEKTTTEEHTTIHTPIATKNATPPIPTTKKATSTGEASSTEGEYT